MTDRDTLSWNRVQAFGAELALVGPAADGGGLRASGWTLGAAPQPYTCRYTLTTDDRWVTTALEVQTEGAGWARSLRLTRRPQNAGWKIRATETGSLAASPAGAEYPETFNDALDVDLAFSPLTNTLPIRRLGLRGRPVGHQYTFPVAFVELPSLAVIANVQRYTVAGDGRIHYESGDYRVEIRVDDDGYVLDYPGLATRVSQARLADGSWSERWDSPRPGQPS